MKLSTFVAVLAWINFFAVNWVMLLNEKVDRPQTIFLCLFFGLLAAISSSIATKKEKNERDGQPPSPL